MKTISIIRLLIIVCFLTILSGCKKLIEVDNPKNQLTSDDVFKEAATINAALVNIYAQIDRAVEPNYNKWICLLSDDFAYIGGATSQNEFYQGNIPITNVNARNLWSNLYLVVYSCNDFVEQIQNTTVIDTKTTETYLAEAKFLRAFSYFYLLNAFDNIPLVLTTDVNRNRLAFQSDPNEIYDQIKKDLNDAIVGFSNGADLNPTKTRASKWAGISLLARVHLFNEEWENAATLASEAIASGLYVPLEHPSNVFQANSRETILELWNQNGFITDATSLIPVSGIPQFTVVSDLLDSFEEDDSRKSDWIHSVDVNDDTYFSPYKYKNRTNNQADPEYLKLFRISEQYLIRAEARFQLGDLNGGLDDLNTIRERAGLAPLSENLSVEEYLQELMKERRLEFFGEWGHRFLDLKRMGLLNQTMTNLKPNWHSKSMALPIPETEIIYNPNLVQNDGY